MPNLSLVAASPIDARRELEDRIEAVVALAARAAARAEGSDVQPVPAIAEPARGGLLGLAADELDFLWSVVARAIDPRVGAHLRAVYGTEARLGISIGQHAALRELPPARTHALLRILDSRHPLRASGLIELVSDGGDVDARWTAPARVTGFLAGSDELDARVAALGGIVHVPADAVLSASQRDVIGKLRCWLAQPDTRDTRDTRDARTLVLEGPQGAGRRTAVALALGTRPAVAIDFARVGLRDAAEALVALRREATLRDAVPILANLDELWAKVAPSDDALLELAVAIDHMTGPIVVTTSTPGIDLRHERRCVLRASWPVPDLETRRTLWISALTGPVASDDELSDSELDQVAERYELGAGGIRAAARSAVTHAAHRGERRPRFGDIVAGVQDNIAERLGELARRVDVKQDWSELVLAPDLLDDVKGLIGRVRHAHFVLERWGFRKKLARGTGVAALFSGPPGTGKTMVAGLIAKQLQLELYQVDLSRIVSKWVGETEKQLAKVFEAAEAGHALLLFDEADSLFAKRSAEVKSATDRYANLEVNYLLQRVESFGGVVILTTNLDTSIDPALRRRLASHIVFGNPESGERVQLWREMLNTGAPVDDIDHETLADEFEEMTGANIRNAVLAAAFLAADEGRTISQQHLRRAARSEYRAMGHVLGKDHGVGGRL